MISGNYCSSPSFIPTRFSRSHHHTLNRPKHQHLILRPSRGRRPHPLPTSILILWSPRSLYSNFTRIRYNLPHHQSRKRKKGNLRIIRNNLCNNGHWPTRLYRMSTPYIYSGNRRRYTSLFHFGHNNYRCTYRY